MNKNAVLCVIPARYGSHRLPGKPLAEINGLPLVMWVYNRALESDAFDQVFVATDDERIRTAVEYHGGSAVMTGSGHASGTDRVHEVALATTSTHVVNLQGDEPTIPPQLLRDFASSLDRLDGNSLLTCVGNATINEMLDPNVVKAVLANNGDALYFSRAPIPYARGGVRGWGYRHTGLYGFTQESLARFCELPRGILEQTERLEQLRALEG
ncbi:MAG: 3-deoxy-manno-octulosonate cytidylyltransferase, partial [Chitinivibrionales bacterium]|nr:3-deoxy-manno-octulosonate cytidylyltransferase [Chitinivibrionales bacterium]MBD3359062.1 3-deoxy-manno-octulosonate cytidylyltransferase [Chitinivibrionales bacterium]